MAKEATNKPEEFDNGETPVIDLESREVKSVDGAQTADQTDAAESDRDSVEPEMRKNASATRDVDEAELAHAETAGLADSSEKAEGQGATGDAAERKVSQEEILRRLTVALTDMREGRDALSMRRDLVSLHDKLIPEIQASQDAAKQSEAASQTATEGLVDLKTLLTKIDGSISGLEGYLLVNLEERLQGLTEATLDNRKSTSVPLWLKLAVAGNLVLSALVLSGLLWPQSIHELIQSISSFSIGDWLTSIEPRA